MNDNENKLYIEYNNIFLEEKNILNSHLNNNINNEDEGLYNIDSNLDLKINFYKKNNDYNNKIIKDVNIIKKIFKKDTNLVVTGPYVRSIIFPNDKYEIKKELLITIVDNDYDEDSNVYDYLIDKSMKSLVIINEIQVFINNKIYKSVSELLLSNSYLDRICIHNNIIKVSKMFILELDKLLKKEYNNNLDPILKKPRDLLCIYEKKKYKNILINFIKKINLNQIEKININEFCNNLVNYKNNKLGLTVIEFLILKIVNENNFMLKDNLRRILIEISKFKYMRSPKYLYYILEIDKDNQNRDILEILNFQTYEYDIQDKREISDLISKNNTNMDIIINSINIDIIKRLILSDDNENFLKFIKIINYENKIYNNTESQTSKKIIELLIENNSKNIILDLVNNSQVNNHYKFYLCLMTQNLNILQNLKDLDNFKEILMNYLEDILEKGLLKSLYYLIKLDKECILNYKDDNNNNILHLLGDKNESNLILDLIIKLDINLINNQNKSKKTPLHIYSEKGYNQKILKLLNNVECNYKLLDENNNTFLHCLNNNSQNLRDIIMKTLSIIDYQNNNGDTVSMIAIKNNNENLFYILKGFDANLLIKDIDGNTVYHYICYKGNCCGLTIPFIENNYGYHPIDYCSLSTNYYNFLNI